MRITSGAWPTNALARIGDQANLEPNTSLVLAIVVVLAWGAAAFAAGSWKTRTREI